MGLWKGFVKAEIMSLAVNGEATGSKKSADSHLSFALPSHVSPALCGGTVSKTHTGTVLNSPRQLGPCTSQVLLPLCHFLFWAMIALVNGARFRRRKALLYLLSQGEGESLNTESCQLLSFFATQLISWFLKWSCSCTGWMCLNASLRRWESADCWIALFHLILMPFSTLSTFLPVPTPSCSKGNQQPVSFKFFLQIVLGECSLICSSKIVSNFLKIKGSESPRIRALYVSS